MIGVTGSVRMILGVIPVHHLAFPGVIDTQADGAILFNRTLDVILGNTVDAFPVAVVAAENIGFRDHVSVQRICAEPHYNMLDVAAQIGYEAVSDIDLLLIVFWYLTRDRIRRTIDPVNDVHGIDIYQNSIFLQEIGLHR